MRSYHLSKFWSADGREENVGPADGHPGSDDARKAATALAKKIRCSKKSDRPSRIIIRERFDGTAVNWAVDSVDV